MVDVDELLDISKKTNNLFKVINEFKEIINNNKPIYREFFNYFKSRDDSPLNETLLISLIKKKSNLIITLYHDVEYLKSHLKSKYLYYLNVSNINGIDNIPASIQDIKNEISKFKEKYYEIKINISKDPDYIKKENIKQEIRNILQNIKEMQKNPTYFIFIKYDEYNLNTLEKDFESFLLLSESN